MKTNRIAINFGFLFLMHLLGVCQIGCAKEPLIEPYVKKSEPDTVLHKDSKYIAVFGDIQYYISNGFSAQGRISVDARPQGKDESRAMWS